MSVENILALHCRIKPQDERSRVTNGLLIFNSDFMIKAKMLRLDSVERALSLRHIFVGAQCPSLSAKIRIINLDRILETGPQQFPVLKIKRVSEAKDYLLNVVIRTQLA